LLTFLSATSSASVSRTLPQYLYSLGSGLVQAAIAIEDGERQLAAQFPGVGITPPGPPGGRRPNYS